MFQRTIMRSRRLLTASGVAALAFAAAGPVFAEEAPAAEETGVSEVIVTATRREQRLQDVPIAITAVSGESLSAAGVVNTEQLAQAVPSLFITSSQQVGLGAQIRLRGVGTATGNAGFEGSVGVFLDGVYLARSNLAFNDLVDVERIEVLRGPQGTLFGKNTSAGTINIITRAPGFDFDAKALLSVGDYNAVRAGGYISGPIYGDKVAASLSAQVNSRDGYIEDAKTGADYNDRNRYVVRGQVLVKPTEDLSLRLIIDNSGRREHATAAVQTKNASTSGVITALGGTVFNPPPGGDGLKVAFNTPLKANADETGVTGILDWNAGPAKVKLILGHRVSDTFSQYDSDFSDLDILSFTRSIKDTTDSAELQVSGVAGPVDWLTGAYYSTLKTRGDGSSLQGQDAGRYYRALASGLLPATFWAPGTGLVSQRFDQDTEGWSIFTHNTWNITSKLGLVVGLRYLQEDKSGGSRFVYNQSLACTSALVPAVIKGVCATNDYGGDYSDDQLNYNLSLQYRFTPDVMAYATASRGFKSGGINLDRQAGGNLGSLPTQPIVFDPETVDNYEAGVKSQFWDRRVTLNATVFYQEYQDLQLNTFTGTQFVVSNVGSAKSQGVEVELTATPIRRLNIRAGALYNETKYGKDVKDALLRGNPLSNAPRWSGTLGADYWAPIGEGPLIWSVRGDLRLQSEMRTASNLNINTRQNGYGILNARIGIRHTRQDWDLSVWSNNLTDTRYKTIGFAVGDAYYSYYGEPRTVGVEFTKRF